MGNLVAIDPGLNNCGWAVFKDNVFQESGTLKMTSKESQEKRLFKIFELIDHLLGKYPGSHLYSEKQFVEVMTQINGVIRAAAGKNAATTTLNVPMSWKKKAFGKGNITEEDLRSKVIDIFPFAFDMDEHQIDCLGMYLAFTNDQKELESGHVQPPKKTRKKQKHLQA